MTELRQLIVGADTHTDTIHVAAITLTGQSVADREFPTTPTDTPQRSRFSTTSVR